MSEEAIEDWGSVDDLTSHIKSVPLYSFTDEDECSRWARWNSLEEAIDWVDFSDNTTNLVVMLTNPITQREALKLELNLDHEGWNTLFVEDYRVGNNGVASLGSPFMLRGSPSRSWNIPFSEHYRNKHQSTYQDMWQIPSFSLHKLTKTELLPTTLTCYTFERNEESVGNQASNAIQFIAKDQELVVSQVYERQFCDPDLKHHVDRVFKGLLNGVLQSLDPYGTVKGIMHPSQAGDYFGGGLRIGQHSVGPVNLTQRRSKPYQVAEAVGNVFGLAYGLLTASLFVAYYVRRDMM